MAVEEAGAWLTRLGCNEDSMKKKKKTPFPIYGSLRAVCSPSWLHLLSVGIPERGGAGPPPFLLHRRQSLK